jgi:hypothetical protein
MVSALILPSTWSLSAGKILSTIIFCCAAIILFRHNKTISIINLFFFIIDYFLLGAFKIVLCILLRNCRWVSHPWGVTHPALDWIPAFTDLQ